MTQQDPAHRQLRALLDVHQERVRRTCFRFVGNQADADDLTQEVFLQVYASLRSFRGEAELATWIYRIAVNKSLDLLRSRSRGKRRAWLVPIHDDAADARAVDSRPDPHAELEETERRRILHAALARLPEAQRAAVVLRDIEGFSNRETASILEVSLKAAEALLHRGRTRLREELRTFFSRGA